MPSFDKPGRWTYAEQRALLAGLRSGKTIEKIAAELRRSVSSAQQKAREFGLDRTPAPLSNAQLAATELAAHQRLLAAKCRELALLAEHQELHNRLIAMAIEYHEAAWVTEARAGLPLTPDVSRLSRKQTGAAAP